MIQRYKHLNNFLKEKFGERTLKICIDGNFTCPNRDGTLDTKGCIFCSERGSGEHLNNISIQDQVINHLNIKEVAQRANFCPISIYSFFYIVWYFESFYFCIIKF